MEKSFEYRIYPNTTQRGQIERTFGCCRWVYNRALEMRMKAFARRKQIIPCNELIKMIPRWKAAFPWLKDADSIALQQALRDLDKAYRNFFREPGRVGFPRFKSRRDSRQSYRTQNIGGKAIAVQDSKHIKLPKLGLIKARVSRMPEGRILSATVKLTPTGKYFVVLCCADCACCPKSATDKTVGIDLGIRKHVTTSDGDIYDNEKPTYRYAKKLKREQKRLSRRQGARKGEAKSANFEKQRIKVARVHEKVANVRKDRMQKITTELIDENQVIVVEDLNVCGMLANRKWAKAVSDVALGELVRELEYKSEWYGRDLVHVGRMFPSSQLCHVCGEKEPKVKDLREKWVCPHCGTHHDRDLNAARNILEEGLRILEEKKEGTAGHAGTAA